ncbi:hypothetical protein J4E85_001132 [Alternaria conjuncta]|uniref:uncharacterized protein n=1 Tax=Alternaria conjuncta TaxID=181017 RepID=UPI00221ED2EB|nr:uncharacterized protein J4E85_001132 [Alternaria conjuncta]KAI4935806.1 hypothetical protein J4E85_001132 [Alternaria conjuncta]
MQLPKTQKAAIKQGTGDNTTITIKEIPVPEPAPDQILVKINYSGLCASDKSLLHDEWDFKMAECTEGIAGHEGAGIVVAVGANVQDLWQIGNRAGIKWIASLNSGFTVAGTFQEYCLTDARYATRLPDGVKDEEAGPIMCGGVTAYVACKRSLGHFGVQYARHMGMRVIAIDGGAAKRDLCLSLGAERFIDFTTCSDITSEIMKITTYGAHGVIVFAATKAGYEQAPHLLRPNGTMVCVGLPKDSSIIAGASPILMCLKRLNVVGSVTGTLKDVEEALDFTSRGLVHPILTHGGLEDIDRFCADMNAGKLAGRAVIKIAA